MLTSLSIARRPSNEKPDVLDEREIQQLRHNLAHLSPEGVRQFYERAFEEGRLVYSRLPSRARCKRWFKRGNNSGDGGDRLSAKATTFLASEIRN